MCSVLSALPGKGSSRKMPMTAAAIALNRFGLGARSGDPLPSDPKSWLLGQLGRFEVRPAALAGVPPRSEIFSQLAEYFAEQRKQGQAKRLAAAMQTAATTDQKGDGIPDSAKRFL